MLRCSLLSVGAAMFRARRADYENDSRQKAGVSEQKVLLSDAKIVHKSFCLHKCTFVVAVFSDVFKVSDRDIDRTSIYERVL